MAIGELGLLVALGLTVAGHAHPAAYQPAQRPSSGGATIYRDRWGMAHIYAARESDGFYAEGYAQAEDRLVQILFQYRRVRGRLAEAFGPGPIDGGRISPQLSSLSRAGDALVPDTVQSDKTFRLYRVFDDAKRNLKRLSAPVRADVEAYAAGVRAFMRDHPERTPPWAIPVEAADAAASTEAIYLMVYGIQNGAKVCDDALREKLSSRSSPPDRPIQRDLGILIRGSNAWVIGNRRTRDGSVIQLSDSHGPFQYWGQFFYTQHIHAGNYDYLASGPAGAPFPPFGHSRYFSWGWTTSPNRLSECYKFDTDPRDPLSYRVDGQLRHISTQEYTIAVRGRQPLTGRFEYVQINSGAAPIVGRVGARAFAVSSPYLGREGLNQDEFREMELATNIGQFRNALNKQELFADNFIVGGRDGTIGYVRTGREPIRSANDDGTRVADGNKQSWEWAGIHPFKDLIQIWNPREQYLVNNNASPDRVLPDNPVRKADFPRSYVIDGESNDRQRRAQEMLSGAWAVTDEIGQEMAKDVKLHGISGWAAAFRQLSVGDGDPDLRQFIAALAAFDGRFTANSKPALYFIVFAHALTAQNDDLSGQIWRHVREGKALDQAEKQLVSASVQEAFNLVSANPGWRDLTFGSVYRVGRSLPGAPGNGVSFLLGGIVPGTTSAQQTGTLNILSFPNAKNNLEPHLATGGQQAPILTVLGKTTRSFSALPFGVSDDPRSPHFADQVQLYARNVLKDDYFNWDSLHQNIESREVLPISNLRYKTDTR